MTRPRDGRSPVPLALLRHGPTDWNALGRTQGRVDRPLSPEGRERVRTWCLPDELAEYHWVTSPLRRAREKYMMRRPSSTLPSASVTSAASWAVSPTSIVSAVPGVTVILMSGASCACRGTASSSKATSALQRKGDRWFIVGGG